MTHTPKPWQSFKRPSVRDLAFCLSPSSPLLRLPAEFGSSEFSLADTAFWQPLFQAYLPRLHELEKNPKPLNQFLARHTTSSRLGFRFEHLIHFWLLDTYYHPFRLIEHSKVIQATVDDSVHKAGQTLGELDFLVHNTQTGAVEHWELSIKFYLATSDPRLPANWRGTNPKDNLHKKLTRLKTHQFQYAKVGDLRIDTKRLFLKGRFFWPADSKLSPPDWINTQHPLDLWRPSTAEDLVQIHTGTLRQAARLEWFTRRWFWPEFSQRNRCTFYQRLPSTLYMQRSSAQQEQRVVLVQPDLFQ